MTASKAVKRLKKWGRSVRKCFEDLENITDLQSYVRQVEIWYPSNTLYNPPFISSEYQLKNKVNGRVVYSCRPEFRNTAFDINALVSEFDDEGKCTITATVNSRKRLIEFLYFLVHADVWD